MQFGILGPLDVRSPAGETIVVGGPRPRALLVILLLNAGRVVGVDQLIDGQYGDAPPAAPSTRCRPRWPACAAPWARS